jgi:HAE1 family hydrophobic/amphiphilic exporter-1
MTTLTILFISLPLILGLGEGAEFRRGLGIVILGGVFSSALLTLFVVPAAFLRFEGPRYAKAEAAKRAEAQRERFNYPDGRPSQAGED